MLFPSWGAPHQASSMIPLQAGVISWGGLAYSLVAGLRVQASLASRVQGSRVHGSELRGPGISSSPVTFTPSPRVADVAGSRFGSRGLGASGAPNSSDWDKSTVLCLQRCVGSPYTGAAVARSGPRDTSVELPRLGSGGAVRSVSIHQALTQRCPCAALVRARVSQPCAPARTACTGRFLSSSRSVLAALAFSGVWPATWWVCMACGEGPSGW